MESREEISVTLTSKSSMVEEVTLAEEDLTKEVEAEELATGVTNATSWGIDHLNVREGRCRTKRSLCSSE